MKVWIVGSGVIIVIAVIVMVVAYLPVAECNAIADKVSKNFELLTVAKETLDSGKLTDEGIATWLEAYNILSEKHDEYVAEYDEKCG